MFTLPYILTFKIQNNQKNYKSPKKKPDIKGEDINTVMEFEMEEEVIVEGDVYIAFYRSYVLGQKEKVFKFWFNTNFVPDNNIYEFKKSAIDKACKDKNCKYYKPGFRIEVHFSNVS